MKLQRITLGLLAALLLTLPATGRAQFNYTANNGAITITGYTGSGGAVMIPSIIDGYPVVSIGNMSFYNKHQITSVTIPNGVTNIGGSAFSHCTALTKITIPNSVTSIRTTAFYDCTSLTSIAIPNSVTSISSGTFYQCQSLTNVIIPNSVTNIEGRAFFYCESLTNITIPNSVTSIGNEAFTYCKSLASFTVPNRVTNIGFAAFHYCYSLTNIAVAPSNPAYSSVGGVLLDLSQTRLIQFPAGFSGRYTIPKSVTSIGNNAFMGCPSVTSVTIPFGVTNIEYLAFDRCGGLNEVYFYGNTPSFVSFGVFDSDYNTVIYYLPGSTGWGATFAERPTALWLPTMQASDTCFGIPTNQFGFNIAWASGQTVVVDACTNLSNPDWQPVQTNTLPSSGAASFSDPQWTNYPGRFYRLRSP